MVIRETALFTRRVVELLSDEEYRQIQAELIARPDVGRIIPGTGGLRKVRWRGMGHGKRGGVRVIYYWAVSDEIILMLFIYGKGEQDDLTPAQKTALRNYIEREYP